MKTRRAISVGGMRYRPRMHEILVDVHNHAFAVLGGVPRRGIYDNMCTAVDRVERGKERDVNARFAAVVSHFLFEAEFCNLALGWEKGQVEKNVRDARHRLWQIVPPLANLPALNTWLSAPAVPSSMLGRSLLSQTSLTPSEIEAWTADECCPLH